MFKENDNTSISGPAQRQGSIGPKPVLLIFDDSTKQLEEHVAKYSRLGFEAIGVPVLLDEMFVNEDGTIKNFIKDKYPFPYGVGNEAQLKLVLKRFKTDAILVDGSMGNDHFTAIGDTRTANGRALIAMAQRILPGVPAALHTSGNVFSGAARPQRDGNVDMFSKDDSAETVASYLHNAIRERSQGATIN